MNLKQHFTTKRLVLMALFVALSYVVSFLEFPIFPVTPYFKLDFANVFIMLTGFLLGPVEGVLVCALKELLSVIDSSSGGVGEIANFLMTSAFILFPAIVYRMKKGFKTVATTLVAACLIGTGVALFVNRFIIFPLYMGAAAQTVFYEVFWYALAFNLIKTLSISLITVLLYKRLSIFLKKKHI
ncbi:MAG: ECF transporter S component [Clostridia bacterium]|nr:ECF transporter S component [Clostridia bacterium]